MLRFSLPAVLALLLTISPSFGQLMDPVPFAAVVTPEAVVLYTAEGHQLPIPGTAGAKDVAFHFEGDSLYVAGPTAIRLISFDGETRRVLTDGWDKIDTLALSGNRVAFAGYTTTAGWSIYTLIGRNANPKFIAHGFAPTWTRYNPVPFHQESSMSTLLFENYTDESAQIWQLIPETRSVERIQYDEAGEIKTAVNVAMSPDSQWMCLCTPDGLRLVEKATGVARKLTDGTYDDTRPVFTMEGDQLYFVRRSRDAKQGRIEPRIMHLDIESGSLREFHPTPATAIALAQSGC